MFNFNRFVRTLLFLVMVSAAAMPTIAQDLGPSFLRPKQDFLGRPYLPNYPSRLFSRDNPARILVIGDSLAQGFGIFLDRRVKERSLSAVVTNKGRTSTGLTRRDFYDWPQEFDTHAVELTPDIVIVHFGTNDRQPIVADSGTIALTSPDWDVAYRAEVRKILDIAARHQTMLYWLGPAPDRKASLNRQMQRIDPIFETETRASRGEYLSLTVLAGGPDGSYSKSTTIAGKRVAIRSGDGSHFTGEGYVYVADTLLNAMRLRTPTMFSGTGTALAGFLQ